MRSLKVAHLTPLMWVGGTERVILDLCLHGAEQQKVVSTTDGPMRAVFEQHGVEVQVGKDGAQLAHYLSDADVVNVHWLGYDPNLLQAVLTAGRPMVCTLHWQSTLPEIPGLVICVAQHVFDRQEQNRDRRVLILNGIDTTRFRPRHAPLDGPKQQRAGPVRILRVCRPDKCADYFWPALLRVMDACPETELTLAGGAAYEAPRVHGLGYRLDIDQLLRQADLFAYTPQPWAGALDLVVLEAMASGLPCVLSDVPCVNEIVEHEVTGLLTPYEDVAAFAAGIKRLVQDTELRETLGRRSVEVARERFEVRDRMPLYSAAYERAFDKDLLP